MKNIVHQYSYEINSFQSFIHLLLRGLVLNTFRMYLNKYEYTYTILYTKTFFKNIFIGLANLSRMKTMQIF